MFIINAYRYLVNLIHTTFDGTNEYIDVGSDASLKQNRSQAQSYSAWIYADSFSNSYIFVGRESGDTINTFAPLRINSSGEFSFWLRGNDSAHSLRVNSNSALSTGQWYHLVATYDGSTNASGVNLYVDGSSVADTDEFDNLISDIDFTSFVFGIGGNGVLGAFDGKIDKVIVYNDVLTSGEVTTIHNYGRKAGLIGIGNEVSQWELDALNPTDVIGSNDGTSTNMDSSNIVVG